jgi:hypothetical protein
MLVSQSLSHFYVWSSETCQEVLGSVNALGSIKFGLDPLPIRTILTLC